MDEGSEGTNGSLDQWKMYRSKTQNFIFGLLEQKNLTIFLYLDPPEEPVPMIVGA